MREFLWADVPLEIRKAILEGDIDKALKLTNTFYPQVLPANPQIYFRLRCRRFVELMRQSTEILDASHHKGNKSMNGHPTAISDDGFDPGMDLDEPMRDGDDWDNMDTEEADANMKYDAHITQMIQYGQELRKEFQHDQSKTVIETFKEIFSMFSYPDPRNSPLGKLLDSSQRDPVAEALNSAILGRCPYSLKQMAPWVLTQKQYLWASHLAQRLNVYISKRLLSSRLSVKTADQVL